MSCVPFLGCELQQNPEPYKFKDDGRDPVVPPETKPSKIVDPVARNPTPVNPSGSRQNPDKSFNEIQRPVVRGNPRHDFPDPVFPE